MKTVEFDGTEFEVEDWVTCVAEDGNGAIYAYEVRPIYCAQYNCWERFYGKSCKLKDPKFNLKLKEV